MKITRTPFSWSAVWRLLGRYDLILVWIDNKHMADTADGGPHEREGYAVVDDEPQEE